MAGPTCTTVRESLSALADGEDAPLTTGECDVHVASCASCADFAGALPLLSRRTRLAMAPEVPDLTADVLAAAARVDLDRDAHRRRQVRGVLAVVGVVQAVLAMVALATDGGHVVRELATWELALGVSFGVAAWQPHRAAGLLPMVAVLGLAAVVGATADLLAGATTLVAETAHLVEVAGVALVAAVARTAPVASPQLVASR